MSLSVCSSILFIVIKKALCLFHCISSSICLSTALFQFLDKRFCFSVHSLVSVGGDGTHYEVIAALIRKTMKDNGVEELTSSTVLQSPSIRHGMIPAGEGSYFVRLLSRYHQKYSVLINNTQSYLINNISSYKHVFLYMYTSFIAYYNRIIYLLFGPGCVLKLL